MTVSKKVSIQKQDPSKVFLFKEGAFYKVYNEGAFLLRDKNYKVSVKQGKKIEPEVLSIGFPENVFKKLQIDFEVHDDKSCYSFTYNKVFDEIEFTNWRDQIVKEQSNIADIKENNRITERLNGNALLKEIKKYPLANETPIQVFVLRQKNINKKDKQIK